MSQLIFDFDSTLYTPEPARSLVPPGNRETEQNLAPGLEKVKLSYRRVLDPQFYQIRARLQTGTGNFADELRNRT